ncbi:hypothetical protein RRF57_012880 [Xylaria bambusicola]|uniref:Uncharacterized protein n=1 Tax=Xylaria bambusicola TaxID=326684 RepID=A0AAN7V4P0_9PEZI
MPIAPADAEEDPGVDNQAHAKAKTDIQQLGRVYSQVLGLALSGRRVDNISASKSEQEEHEGACELAQHGYDVVLDLERQAI